MTLAERKVTGNFHRLVLVLSIIGSGTAFRSVTTVPVRRIAHSPTTYHVAFLPDTDSVLQPMPIKTDVVDDESRLSERTAAITKFSMVAFIASMCLALPVSLFPTWALFKAGCISTLQREQRSLSTAETCARGLFTIMPFVDVTVMSEEDQTNTAPEPSIWCANHVSALDTFMFLATDEKLRGKNRRPLKVVYWKGLDENPVTKLLFHMAGFIPVQMEANGSGNANEYDQGSFLTMLRLTKQAFKDGFDVFILPEGQLNPNPEQGLLPVFSGAFALARMSQRPIRFVGVHGTHRLWHADESVGMTVTGRDIKMRTYPRAHKFETADDFVGAFTAVVGHFGKTGEDLPENELQMWLP